MKEIDAKEKLGGVASKVEYPKDSGAWWDRPHLPAPGEGPMGAHLNVGFETLKMHLGQPPTYQRSCATWQVTFR